MRLFKENNSRMALITLLVALGACGDDQPDADAYGNFEVDETIISAQVSGEIMEFNIAEGQWLDSGEFVGYIDTTELVIGKQEVMANIHATEIQKINISSEKEVLKAELANVVREIRRVEKLLKSDAATTKQLDDLEGNLNVINQRLKALDSQYEVINARIIAIASKLKLLDEKIRKSVLINPVQGRVLTRLAEPHEITSAGRPLYKIADLNNIYLKAYISERQLSQITLGQQVTISIDSGPDVRSFPGTVSWVASESQFTPKIIQTREERVNLVYAIKVAVDNDGALKIGMPGEVIFQ